MTNIKPSAFLLAALFTTLSLQCVFGDQLPPSQSVAAPPAATTVGTTATSPGLTALDPGTIDTSVMPCKDFYQYSNGLWLKRNTIPADRSEWSIGSEAEKRNLVVLQSICEDAAGDKTAAPSTDVYKVGALFRTGMDTQKIQRDGISPLQSELARISAIHTLNNLVDETARLHRYQVGAIFNFYVGADYKNSKVQIPQLYQGGLGMPDRDYYLKSDADTVRVRNAYIKHVQRDFVLMGDSAATAQHEAATVMRIETRLAKVSQTEVEQRDPMATYHKMTLAQFQDTTPGMNWKRYFRQIGVLNPQSLNYNISQPKFYQEVSRMMVRQTPLSDWKTYLRWQLVAAYSPYLSPAFENEDFAFNGVVLSGRTKMRPRWERVEGVIDSEIGEALGKLYVERTFSPEAKAKATEVVVNVKSVLRDRLANLEWMSPATRKLAVAKCDAMIIKVGYPDKWRDYSRLHIDDHSYLMNVERANEFEFQRNLNKIGLPVDRLEWGMTTPTINAYYEDSTNTINFPAAILQPPFFDPSYDDAVNYGELGDTVGHELTHGFDDEGHKFDAAGNLHNWWTDQDSKNFTQRADLIVKQFSAYSPLPGMHINGELTEGENIADIGGLKIAYEALEKTLENQPKTTIDGFTPEQRFFLSYAQGWRTLQRPQSLREQVNTDPHSPALFRVNGPCYDMPEFFQAFGCPVPDAAKSAGVW